MVQLSVIVPARNAASTIGEQLDALLAEPGGDWEIVVVDNRSTDGTAAIVEQHARRDRRVRLVAAVDGDGPAYARNVGITHASSDRLALCDADDVVAAGWVDAMERALREHEYVAGRLDVRRLNPPAAIAARPGVDRDGPGLFLRSIPFAHSCNLGVRRSVLDGHGPFRPEFSDSADVELGMRLRSAGVALHYAPDALVHYRLRDTAAAAWRQARRNGWYYPKLVSEAARRGLRPPSRADGLRYWPWLVRRAPLLRSDAGRARWCFVAGTAVGRLEGSLRHRALYV